MTTAAPGPAVPAAPKVPATRAEGGGRTRLPGTRRAAGDVARVLVVRAVLALIGAVAAVVGAVAMWQRSMHDSDFGPYLGKTLTPVTRYSGPWIVGAAGLALVAGLLVVAAVTDSHRAIRLRRLSRPGR